MRLWAVGCLLLALVTPGCLHPTTGRYVPPDPFAAPVDPAEIIARQPLECHPEITAEEVSTDLPDGSCPFGRRNGECVTGCAVHFERGDTTTGEWRFDEGGELVFMRREGPQRRVRREWYARRRDASLVLIHDVALSSAPGELGVGQPDEIFADEHWVSRLVVDGDDCHRQRVGRPRALRETIELDDGLHASTRSWRDGRVVYVSRREPIDDERVILVERRADGPATFLELEQRVRSNDGGMEVRTFLPYGTIYVERVDALADEVEFYRTYNSNGTPGARDSRRTRTPLGEGRSREETEHGCRVSTSSPPTFLRIEDCNGRLLAEVARTQEGRALQILEHFGDYSSLLRVDRTPDGTARRVVFEYNGEVDVDIVGEFDAAGRLVSEREVDGCRTRQLTRSFDSEGRLTRSEVTVAYGGECETEPGRHDVMNFRYEDCSADVRRQVFPEHESLLELDQW